MFEQDIDQTHVLDAHHALQNGGRDRIVAIRNDHGNTEKRELERYLWDHASGVAANARRHSSRRPVQALDEATTPTLPFPCGFLDFAPAFYANGATINGLQTDNFGISPEGDADRY